MGPRIFPCFTPMVHVIICVTSSSVNSTSKFSCKDLRRLISSKLLIRSRKNTQDSFPCSRRFRRAILTVKLETLSKDDGMISSTGFPLNDVNFWKRACVVEGDSLKDSRYRNFENSILHKSRCCENVGKWLLQFLKPKKPVLLLREKLKGKFDFKYKTCTSTIKERRSKVRFEL